MTHLMQAQPEAPTTSERRSKTSLFHRILLTFHDACDARDLDVATRLLTILESLATAQDNAVPPERTRALRGLVAAHERLWALRFGDAIEPDRPRR
jgi:hypothetical protein